MLALFLLSSTSAFAIDTGNGSDGACTNASFVVAKRSYQCTTLTINASLNIFKAVGGAQVVIKVQGDVNITAAGTIDLSGANGSAGDLVGSVAGGLGGAGGSAGGNSGDATIGISMDGSNGNGSGAGVGGKFVNAVGGTSYGGGGGGGSFKDVSATLASNGDDGVASKVNTAGANGSTYFPEANFDTSFAGGSGGAAGGGGVDVATPHSGSSGGGGGGAIRIVSGGNILIDGSIISKGGNGGGTAGITVSSGGGGGASGGGIWLQAAGTLTVSAGAVITALPGVHGDNLSNGFSGIGGDGGNGRIRLDSGNGVITNAGTINPAPYSTSFTPTPISSGTTAISRQYSSAVSCARVSLEHDQSKNIMLNILVGILIASLGHLIVSRSGKV